jgi:hypothetical protein
MAISPAEYDRLSDLADDRVHDMDEATRAKYALRYCELTRDGQMQLDAYIANEVLAGLIADAEDFKGESRMVA